VEKEALDAAADGYITKPFSLPELAARLRSAVRRSGNTSDAGIPNRGGKHRSRCRTPGGAQGRIGLKADSKEFDLPHYLGAAAARPSIIRGSRKRCGAPNTAGNWSISVPSSISRGGNWSTIRLLPRIR
jgi:hypothetical protein